MAAGKWKFSNTCDKCGIPCRDTSQLEKHKSRAHGLDSGSPDPLFSMKEYLGYWGSVTSIVVKITVTQLGKESIEFGDVIRVSPELLKSASGVRAIGDRVGRSVEETLKVMPDKKTLPYTTKKVEAASEGLLGKSGELYKAMYESLTKKGIYGDFLPEWELEGITYDE